MRRDKEARTGKENEGIEATASRLAWAFYRKPLVMLFEPDRNGAIAGQGSGTLVRAASGRAVILTAAHVLDGASRMHALMDDGVLCDVVAEVRTMGPRVDVALGVRADSAHIFDALALDSALIGDGPEAMVQKGNTVDVIGFPESVAVRVPDLRGGLRQLHGDMIHRTDVAGFDRNAISLIWKEGDIVEGSTPMYEAAGFEIGSRVTQRKPSGISGGAVWKQLRADDGVWTADKVFRMIAIPHEFKDGKQLAVPSTRWLPWLREQLASL